MTFKWPWKRYPTKEGQEVHESARVEPYIAIGSKWVLKPEGDPFPYRYPPAEILDVKSGWVRYSMGPHHQSLFPDNRREILEFLRMYEPFK
jgi:hypothetical protein